MLLSESRVRMRRRLLAARASRARRNHRNIMDHPLITIRMPIRAVANRDRITLKSKAGRRICDKCEKHEYFAR